MPTKTKEKPEAKPEVRPIEPDIDPSRILSPERLCPTQKETIITTIREI